MNCIRKCAAFAVNLSVSQNQPSQLSIYFKNLARTVLLLVFIWMVSANTAIHAQQILKQSDEEMLQKLGQEYLDAMKARHANDPDFEALMQEKLNFGNNDKGEETISAVFQSAVAPVNDLCADAIPVMCGDVVNGTTTGATTNGDPIGDFCGTAVTTEGVWYTIVGHGGPIVLSTCNAANYDTKLFAYTGSCGVLVCEAGNDDTGGCAGLTTELSFFGNPGVTYYIFVSGFDGATGDFTMTVTCPEIPVNDLCENAILVECCTEVTGNTEFSTAIGAPAQDCFVADPFSDDVGPGIWYKFIGTGDWVELSTCDDANFDTKIDVLTGECGALTCYAGNDDGEGCSGFSSAFGFQTVVGETYYIYVSGFTVNGLGTSLGTFTLTICPLCRIDDVSLDPFWNPAGGLFCQVDGTYYLDLRVDGPTIETLPRNGDGTVDLSELSVTVNGQDLANDIFGLGFDPITVPGVTYMYIEMLGVSGDGTMDADVSVRLSEQCRRVFEDVYDEPLCPCFTGVGEDLTVCDGSVVAVSAITSGSGSWSTVSGSGYFEDPNSPNTNYFPAEGDNGSTVILRWTTNAFGGCNQMSDDMEINFFHCIPTLSEWGIIILGMSILIIGLVFIRQRKRIFHLT